jgi:hypothetical protein
LIVSTLSEERDHQSPDSPDDVTIGEHAAGHSDGGTIYIDKVYILDGYEDADPY